MTFELAALILTMIVIVAVAVVGFSEINTTDP